MMTWSNMITMSSAPVVQSLHQSTVFKVGNVAQIARTSVSFPICVVSCFSVGQSFIGTVSPESVGANKASYGGFRLTADLANRLAGRAVT